MRIRRLVQHPMFVPLWGGLFAAGCVGRSALTLGDLPVAPTTLATVSVTPPASIVAVGGTQQLTTTGLTYAGVPVTTFDSVLYQYNTATDSTRVRVSSAGLLTGVTAVPSGMLINALVFSGQVIRGDQVIVQVTAAAVSGLVLSVQPSPPDSTKVAAGVTKTIVPVLRNPATGASVASPAVMLKVKGTDATRVDVYGPQILYRGYSGTDFLRLRSQSVNGALTPAQFAVLSGKGSVWLYATVAVYGTILQDSVQYTFTYPYTATLSTVKTNLEVTNLYAGQMLSLAPGATVTFQNGVGATDPLTVAYVFDNPAAATAAATPSSIGGASGNVTSLTGGQVSNRRFLTPGSYRWTMTPSGGPAPWPGQVLSGTIVIK